MTELDTAYDLMAGGDEAAGLRFYRALADATLFIVLDREAEGEVIAPRVFDLESGPVILAFDSEERLASLGPDPVPYAALPGRIVAQQMLGQGLSLGLNLGTGAGAETLLPPEALEWLVQMLGSAPANLEAQAQEFRAPKSVPQMLITALERTITGAAGLAAAALLAEVRYTDGTQGHIFAFVNADLFAQAALARSVAEALAFSGMDAAALDVTFLQDGDKATAKLLQVARLFEVPEPVIEQPVQRLAPGMDPLAPPKLR